MTRRTFALTLLGVLLLQAAWILVVPPFRGIDEFDHAFKAAAVARGDLSPHHTPATKGWGEFMSVPRDLVVAAQPICESFGYTTDSNCRPDVTEGPGTAQVASSAARYDPAFYLVVGTAARPFHGTAALYAMRVAAALLTALLLAAAVSVIAGWARTRVLPAAVLLTLTPVVLYSTTVAAPNGVELAGACLLWACLLGVGRLPTGDRAVSRLIGLATLGAVPVAVVRTLGPVWVVLIVATCLLLMPREQLRHVVGLRAFRLGAALTVLALTCGAAWSVVAGTNEVTDVGNSFTGVWADLPREFALWFAQSWAAFPSRFDLAPMAVYAVGLTAWWVLAALALRQATGRERLALGTVFLVSTLIPCVITVQAYSQAGALWQGRYGYPYAMGFVLVCGLVLDRRSHGVRVDRLVLAAAGSVVVFTELLGQLHVLSGQRRSSPLAGTAAWPAPSVLLVTVLTVAGTALLLVALAGVRSPQPAGPSTGTSDRSEPPIVDAPIAHVGHVSARTARTSRGRRVAARGFLG